jgi:hypothetical protein
MRRAFPSGALIAIAVALWGCAQQEPVGSSVAPVTSATAGATATPTTTLGAVSLPDTKRCVSECTRGGAGVSSEKGTEADCRKRCMQECLEHCKQKRSSMPDFETVCAKDCEAQQELLP